MGCVKYIMTNTISEPVIGRPLRRGALISKLVLNASGEVVSGECAYDSIVDPAGNELPPAEATLQ